MKQSGRIGLPLALSVLLHVALALLLLFVAHKTVVRQPAPVSVELWTSAPLAPPVSAPPAVVSPPVPPAPAETPVAPETPEPGAEIQLGRKPHPHRIEASVPRVETPPVHKKPIEAPVKKSVPEQKPVPEKKPTPGKKILAEKTAESTIDALLPARPGKGKKPAQHYSDDTNDLLSDLNSSNTTRPATARSDQAGSPNGVAGGVSNGNPNARSDYITKVRARVYPFVQIPPDMSGNPAVIVQVLLWPTLEVREVKLLQSSGNAAYDESVQRAIMQARTFPALPAGAVFADYRKMRLVFRPKQ